jgi:outer membrane protein TolC
MPLAYPKQHGVQSRRGTHPFKLGIAGLVLAIIGHTGYAAPMALTLTQAQQQALARSRSLPAADAAVSAAQEMAVAAGRLPDPVLSVGVDNLPISGADRFSIGNDSMTMRRIGIMQEFTRSEKRRLRATQYEEEADKARLEKSLTEIQIERDVAFAWLDLYYADREVDVVTEQVRQSELEVTAAEGAYRGGRAQQVDVYMARKAVALLRDQASRAETKRATARTMLMRWLGSDSIPALAEAPDIDHLRLDPEMLENHLVHHPRLAALQAQERIARTEARLADAERSPDWSLQVALQQRGPGYSNMISVGVSVPLQWDRGHRQDRVLAAKMALADAAQDEREEALREHVAEIRTMLGEWESGRARLQRFRDEILPLATARSTAAMAAYRGVKGSLAEVVSARAGELDTRLQQLTLEQETARLWARLNYLYPIKEQ